MVKPPSSSLRRARAELRGREGGLRVHARFQKTLQQADGQLALPAGRHAAAHAVAQENVEHAAVGLEERARVPAHGLAVLLPGGHAHDGLEGFGLGKDQPLQLAGLPLLRLPQGQAQQVGEGGALRSVRRDERSGASISARRWPASS